MAMPKQDNNKTQQVKSLCIKGI